MPLPMVHLAIAYQVHQHANLALTPGFVLGSLSPDAIHMRPNTDRSDKDRVHLGVTALSEPEALARIRSLLDESQQAGNGFDPFAQGYAGHLITDYLWLQDIGKPFFQQIPETASPEERRAWYYRETDQVDFNLYNHAPWRASVWELLASADALEFPPHLSAGEIDQWRLRTLIWFHKTKQEPGIVPEIITDRVVADFIADAARRVQSMISIGDGQRPDDC